MEPPGTLVRIDPASNRVVGKAVPAGTSPIYVAASPSGLWVADFDTGDLLHLAPLAVSSSGDDEGLVADGGPNAQPCLV
jgi:DNA-binding beta-propeller fold protein YncE